MCRSRSAGLISYLKFISYTKSVINRMKLFEQLKSFIRNDNPEAQVKWSLYGRVWRELGRPHWRLLLAGVICIVIASGAEAFAITLVKQVIDEGFIEKNMDSLYFIGAQVVGTYACKGLFTYGKSVFMAKAGLMGATSLRRRMYQHMVKLHIGYFHGAKTGPLMNSFTNLANAVMGLITDRLIGVVQNIATVIMMLGLMLWYAPQMTGIVLVIVPSIIIPLTIIMRKRRVLTRRTFAADAGSISHIAQSISGVKTIQAFGAEDIESRNMDAIEDHRIKMVLKSAKLSSLQSPLLELMISFGLCGSLLLGGHFITSGSMSTGDFAAFILALTAAYKPAKSLSSVGGSIQNGLIAAEALFKFLDMKSEIGDAPDAVELRREPMTVKLDDISFAYNKKHGNVLHNITLEVAPGTICAFVGPSGGGKSTIFNLLARFYELQHGQILINGTDIRKYTLASLRTNIASVSQDVFLFNASIADNIRYGSPGATDAQVEEAAKAANAHEFIVKFPQQYKTSVGERGDLLSGGQKQRIAIARAILKDAPILLLDEATSALDSYSERLIQDALRTLMQGRTTFVIAHRLATILDADMICVIKNGRIVEQGTDATLSKMDGDYKKLKDIQFNTEGKTEATEGSVAKTK